MVSLVPLREQPSESVFSELYIYACHIVLMRRSHIFSVGAVFLFGQNGIALVDILSQSIGHIHGSPFIFRL